MRIFKLLFCLAFLSIVNTVHAQEVPEVQRPLISKVAATWCPPCGGWGWTFFEELIVDNEEHATLLVAHHSGDLFNETSKAFSDNFDAPYQPYFYVYNADQEVTASNAAEKRIEIKNAVDFESITNPIANSIAIATVTDDKIDISTQTKFFQDANGIFSVGHYVVESGIINNQEGIGPNAIHEKVLRGSFTEHAFGIPLSNTAILAGDGWVGGYGIPIEANWNLANIEIVSIVWQQVNGKYLAVNTYVQEEIEIISSLTEDFGQQVKLEVLPTAFSNQAQVDLNLEVPLQNAMLEVVDINGKQVSVLHDGPLNAGAAQFSIDRTNLGQTGMYFLVLRSGDKNISRKIVVE